MKLWESRDGLVKKEVLMTGCFSDKPTELSLCKILINKIELNHKSTEDSIMQIREELHSEIIDNEKRKEITIGKGSSKIDKLIERVIQTMSLNERSLISLNIPSDHLQNPINVTLDMTLSEVKPYKPIWDWSVLEKYEAALCYKEKGVKLFIAKRQVDAFYQFSKACKIIITSEPIEVNENMSAKLLELKTILYNNMAECQLVKQNYENAIALCNKVLVKDKKNIKALYRRGVAFGGLRDFEKAVNDLKELLSIDHTNKKALEKYNCFNEEWQKSVKGYQNVVKKMFEVP